MGDEGGGWERGWGVDTCLSDRATSAAPRAGGGRCTAADVCYCLWHTDIAARCANVAANTQHSPQLRRRLPRMDIPCILTDCAHCLSDYTTTVANYGPAGELTMGAGRGSSCSGNGGISGRRQRRVVCVGESPVENAQLHRPRLALSVLQEGYFATSREQLCGIRSLRSR